MAKQKSKLHKFGVRFFSGLAAAFLWSLFAVGVGINNSAIYGWGILAFFLLGGHLGIKFMNRGEEKNQEKDSIQESKAEPTIKHKMIPGLTPAENSIYNDYKEMIQNDGNQNMEDILAKLKKKHKLDKKYITNAIEQGKKYERTSS